MQGRGIVEAVVQLHRLELDEAAAREPRQQDVLRHLPVGPGGGPDGVGHAVAVDDHRQVEVRRPPPEAPRGQVEDLLLALRLPQHPREQVREGRRDELGHARTSRRIIARGQVLK